MKRMIIPLRLKPGENLNIFVLKMGKLLMIKLCAMKNTKLKSDDLKWIQVNIYMRLNRLCGAILSDAESCIAMRKVNTEYPNEMYM